jgi:hypothetical protein
LLKVELGVLQVLAEFLAEFVHGVVLVVVEVVVRGQNWKEYAL